MLSYDEKLSTYLKALEAEDKKTAVKIYKEILSSAEYGIKEIYNDFIISPMKKWNCNFEEEDLCIWKEHIMSSILHTLVECTYPVISRLSSNYGNGKKVIITCPTEELHDLGIRIISDLFELSGYNVIYAGNNTPLKTIIKAIEYENPDIVIISVTTKYNLIFAMKIIKAIVEKTPKQKIIIGGQGITGEEKILSEYTNVNLIQDEILPEYLELIRNKEGEGL